ncbi:hypothetical protein BDV39DRAFT_169253, partial [Aspergillus sergii]
MNNQGTVLYDLGIWYDDFPQFHPGAVRCMATLNCILFNITLVANCLLVPYSVKCNWILHAHIFVQHTPSTMSLKMKL